jgi:hypothetical protein
MNAQQSNMHLPWQYYSWFVTDVCFWPTSLVGSQIRTEKQGHNFSVESAHLVLFLVFKWLETYLQEKARPRPRSTMISLFCCRHCQVHRRLSAVSMIPLASSAPFTLFTTESSRQCTVATGPRPRPVHAQCLTIECGWLLCTCSLQWANHSFSV